MLPEVEYRDSHPPNSVYADEVDVEDELDDEETDDVVDEEKEEEKEEEEEEVDDPPTVIELELDVESWLVVVRVFVAPEEVLEPGSENVVFELVGGGKIDADEVSCEEVFCEPVVVGPPVGPRSA